MHPKVRSTLNLDLPMSLLIFFSNKLKVCFYRLLLEYDLLVSVL
jgi:hypothetical protein